MKIRNVSPLFLFSILQAVFLASCENFLSGSDFISKLDSDISYVNAKECVITVSSDAAGGTFLSSGEHKCKTGYTINLQFNLKTDSYIFKTLEAVSTTDNSVSRSSCVDFIPVEKNSETGVFKYTVKLLKASDDILIRPVCTLIPKIAEVYPPYAPQGYDQDSMVKITFNKSMSPESFGNFSCIHFSDAAGHDVSSYYDYGEFKFSDAGTVLYMPVVKNKPLVDETLSEYADVLLSLDFSDVCDGEGYKMNERKSYSYRLNKNTDKTAPVITFAEVTTTADESAWYFRSLTDKAFSEWPDDTVYEENGTAIKYYYGDYSRNHVGKSVHIKVQGCDNTDSVYAVKVREVLKKFASGKAAAENERTTLYEVSKVLKNGEPSLSDDGKTLYEADFDYEFYNKTDGIVLLEIMLVDGAGNTGCRDYSMIKQGSTNKGIQFELEFDEAGVLPEYTDGKYRSRLRVPEGKTFTIPPEKMYENYDSISSRFALHFYDESDTERAVFNFSRAEDFIELMDGNGTVDLTGAFNEKQLYLNPYRDTKLKAVFEEENGLTKEYEFIFPRATDALSYSSSESEFGKSFSLYTSTKLICRGMINFGDGGRVYVVKMAKETSEVLEESFCVINFKDKFALYDLITETNSYDYKIYVKNEYEYNLGGNISKFTTAYGKPCGTENDGYNMDLQFTIKPPVPGSSAGKSVIEIDVDYPDDGNEYVIFCYEKYHTYDCFYSAPGEKTVTVGNGDVYNLSIYRIHPVLGITGRTGERIVSVDAGDNYPPYFKTVDKNYYDSSFFYIDNILIYDKKDIHGTSYFPCSELLCCYCTSDLGEAPSSEAVENNSVASGIIHLEGSSAKIPFSDLGQGEYYLYTYLEDDAGNGQYTRLSDRLCFVLRNAVPYVEYISSENLKLCKPEGYDSVLMRRYLLKGENNNCSWELNEDYEYNSETASEDYRSTKNHFVKVCSRESGGYYGYYHLMPLYYYPDYVNGEVTCNNAAWLKVSNGWQIFCDAPAFCHTLYSKLKITSTSGESEAMEWEARGQETGLVVSADGKGFTYRDSNLKDIPAGCWYTTICHFADGTVLMSDVQQK